MISPATNLDAYELERADFQRVLHAVTTIQNAAMTDLQSFDWLLNVVRGAGLVPIPESAETYVGEDEYLNASQQGLIQLPREFVRYLLLLSEIRPATYLEIGCFNGATACIATAYLQRFNTSLQAVTLDLWPAFIFYPMVRDLLPLRYVVGKTSFEFRDEKFDAVFIDGDHSFDWAWADYQNVGQKARVCALHDVNNGPYRELPLGGVCAVWELIKREETDAQFVEIFEHPSHEIMGIGVRILPG